MNNYSDLQNQLLLDEYQDLTDQQILDKINTPILVGLTSPFIVNLNSLAINYNLNYSLVLQLIVELKTLQSQSDPITATQLDLVLSGQIDLSNSIVRLQLDGMISQAPAGTAMAELLPQIKKLPENWQSESQIIMGRDITQLDLTKARLIRTSQINFDQQHQIFIETLNQIEYGDGSQTPYGAE